MYDYPLDLVGSSPLVVMNKRILIRLPSCHAFFFLFAVSVSVISPGRALHWYFHPMSGCVLLPATIPVATVEIITVVTTAGV
jgi:hypothetical protein